MALKALQLTEEDMIFLLGCFIGDVEFGQPILDDIDDKDDLERFQWDDETRGFIVTYREPVKALVHPNGIQYGDKVVTDEQLLRRIHAKLSIHDKPGWDQANELVRLLSQVRAKTVVRRVSIPRHLCPLFTSLFYEAPTNGQEASPEASQPEASQGLPVRQVQGQERQGRQGRQVFVWHVDAGLHPSDVGLDSPPS